MQGRPGPVLGSPAPIQGGIPGRRRIPTRPRRPHGMTARVRDGSIATCRSVRPYRANPERVPDSSIRGKTWPQKIMHIASKSHGDNRFDFKPYKHGTYSTTLEESVTRCSQGDLICTNHPNGDDGPIHTTDRGKERMDPDKYEDNMLLELQAMKSVLNNLDYHQMRLLVCVVSRDGRKQRDCK